jgi:hypothetical protein
MEPMENVQESVVEGLPREQMDALMTEMLANKDAGSNVETGSAAGEWDTLTLLTGGFVPVGSIFWARPPKLKNQQRIMLTLQKAQQVMLPFIPKEGESDDATSQEGFLTALFEQGNVMAALAADLFYVYECEHAPESVADLLREGKLTLTKADFRPATEEEITCDETGLTAEEIMSSMNRLMGMSQEAAGNA